MPRWLVTILLIIELLVCFGPAVLVLMLGSFMLPTWVIMFGGHLNGTVVPSNNDAGLPWDLILPIAVVVLGLVGMIGLLRVAALVLLARRSAANRIFTLFCVAAGIASLVLFNGMMEGIDPREAFLGSMVFAILPAIGSVHFVFLARRALFPLAR